MPTEIVPPTHDFFRPKVKITADGVSAYTFTRQTDGWTWTSSDQPQQQPYNGQELPIADGGAVTAIDGTRSFEVASLSQTLESNSSRFLVLGVVGDLFHVTLETKPGSSAVDYIKNEQDGLYLQATGDDGASEGVTQERFQSGQEGFQWRFIDLGNNVYRVYSVGTGRILYAESAHKYQSLRTSKSPNPGAAVNWYRDGNLFRAVLDMALVCDVKSASSSAGAYIHLYPEKSSKNGQQFSLSTNQPS